MRQTDVIDVCCGGREFYFERGDVLACDIHPRVATLCDGREFECSPDVVCDFTDLPFDDESFNLVIFDPPHLLRGKGWQAEKYGLLPKDWKPFLAGGFSECWRVLSPGGTLVFKWSDVQLGLSDIRPCFPASPLFGNRRPRASKTHWLVFHKNEHESRRLEGCDRGALLKLASDLEAQQMNKGIRMPGPYMEPGEAARRIREACGVDLRDD